MCGIITARVSESGNAIASVRLSVCLCILYLLNRLTFDADLLHVSIVMTMARRRLKVKVVCQGQGYRLGFAIGLTSMEVRPRLFASFSETFADFEELPL